MCAYVEEQGIQEK